jgi:hypothetical protein
MDAIHSTPFTAKDYCDHHAELMHLYPVTLWTNDTIIKCVDLMLNRFVKTFEE